MRKRWGCLSIYGIFAALATLIVISGMALVRGGGWFSPGTLNGMAGEKQLGGVSSHADIGGRCSACHTAPWEIERMSDRCLACHTDLAQSPTDFHRVMLAEAELTPCYVCHTDHNGLRGELTRMDLAEFPHDQVGFSLQAHQEMEGAAFKCSDCHGDSFTQFDPITCVSCHTNLDVASTQMHVENFGRDCLSCHDGVDRFGKSFDHNQLAFGLRGKHANVDCKKCHQVAFTLAQLQAAPQMCISCHQKDDPHLGSLGHECDRCHTPEDWKQVTFDHTTSDFSLIGEHLNVDCGKCHLKDANMTVFRGTPKLCEACHRQNDVHEGKLGKECENCHTPIDWNQATFDHSLSGFTLVGKHTDLECSKCHVQVGSKKVLKGTPVECVACHQKDDFHQGELGTECETCHTPTDWKQVTFDHALSSFPLTGQHVGLECGACHVRNPDGTVVFRGTPSTCFACHQKDDPHRGQFGQDCAFCHSTGGWLPANFNHSKTGFPLTGAHARVSCGACHKNNIFRGTPSNCNACHAEPAYHQGMFGQACGGCHSTKGWAPAKYNGPHTFPMGHGRANTCRDCHRNSLKGYTCYTCHDQGEIAKKHQEEGITNYSNCIGCHPTGKKDDD